MLNNAPNAAIAPAPRTAARHAPRANWLPATLASLACCSFAALASLAGPATVPAADPATAAATTNPADAILDRLLTPPATRPQRPLPAGGLSGETNLATGSGPDAVAPDTRPQPLLREGTYVVDRPGYARRTQDGRVEFVFASDGSNPDAAGDPPMVLMPNLNLQALENAADGDPGRRFRVTGRVSEYRGRNHLLLEKVVAVRD